MKILLIYYTGTYNTKYLTEWLRTSLVEKGHKVVTVQVDKDTPTVSTDGYDFIGFGYPIYAFNSPQMFNGYVKKLKFTKGQKFFIYKQSGETYKVNNASSRTLKKIIRRNKGDLVAEQHFMFPYNIHFRMEDNFIKQELYYDAKLLKVLVYEIENGLRDVIKSNVFYNIHSFILSIQKPGAHINGLFYRVDKKKCTKCGQCIRECPAHNISMKKDKIHFSSHCQMCMRCTMFCPHDAIKMGLFNGWRVNGRYHFDKIEKDESLAGDYINGEEKGFYKCFKPSFDEIDEKYGLIFGNSDNNDTNQEKQLIEEQ